MPERWERRLQALAEVHAPPSIDRRLEEGPRSHDVGPTTRGRLAAGLVAFAVFAAAGAFAWRAFDGDATGSVADAPDGLPTLSVQLQSAGFLPDTPPDEDPTPKIATTIDYGDLHEQDFTSTTPDGVIVDWVGVEDLTRLAPGPVVGSRVAVSTDGGDGRVLIGVPSDWPNFDQFERINTLPAEPGEYVLVFAADYPQGMALTARAVTLVPPGSMQLTMEEGGELDAATASASVDGQRLGGFLSTSRFSSSDVGAGAPSRSPDFEDVSPLQIEEGARIVLSSPADVAEAGLYATDAIPDRLPVDLREGPWVPHEPPGNYHLVVEAIWRHGKTGYGQTGTEEWARFIFPVEIVQREESPLPTPVESSPTSPGPPASNPVLLVSTQGPSGDDALLEGELALNNGCVGAQNGEVFTYLIWPAGTSLTPPSEPLAVVDGSGAAIASIGDTIRMGGGVDFLGSAEGVVDGGIPPACAEDGEHYWYVGQIEQVKGDGPTGVGGTHQSTSQSCDPDLGYVWRTRMAPWLTSILVSVGSPDGQPLAVEDMSDTGSALRITDVHDDVILYVHASAPDLEHDPRPSMVKFGSSGDYELYTSGEGLVRQFGAFAPSTWLTLGAYAKTASIASRWESDTDVRGWLDRVIAEMATNPIPTC